MTYATDTFGMSARDTQKWRRRRKRDELAALKCAVEQMLEDYCRETGVGWHTENKGARVREEARSRPSEAADATPSIRRVRASAAAPDARAHGGGCRRASG